MQNYYHILGIKVHASEHELHQAYLHGAKQYHPDLNPGNAFALERFKALQEAYRVLSKPELREAYDEFLHGFEDEGHQEDRIHHLDSFGTSLYQNLEIAVSLNEACFGCIKHLRLPWKDPEGLASLRDFELAVPAGAIHGQRLSLSEVGAEEQLGVHFLLKILVPQSLNRRQRRLLAEFELNADPASYPRRQAFHMRMSHG